MDWRVDYVLASSALTVSPPLSDHISSGCSCGVLSIVANISACSLPCSLPLYRLSTLPPFVFASIYPSQLRASPSFHAR